MPVFGGAEELPDISLHQLLWDGMRKYGNSPAFVDATSVERIITYTELYDNSRKCSAYLQSIGIKKGDFVAICAFDSLEYIYLMIGILGCGATFAPCKPTYGKNEILYQFSIACPKLVFVDEETVKTIMSVKKEAPGVQNILMIGQSSEFLTLTEIIQKVNADSLQQVDVSPECDLAFVAHSSGTTGLPKCAMLTHRNLVSSILIRSRFFSPEVSESFYCDRAMYHSAGFLPIFGCIVSGIKTIVERDCHLHKMFRDIEKYKITGAYCLPPMLIKMVNTSEDGMYDLSSLKLITSGGAVHPPDVIKRIINKYKVQFWTDYGLTEADAISFGIVLGDEDYGSSGQIQKGVELKIIHIATEEECAAGVRGEIRVRTPQVTKGYRGNPVATAAAISPDGWFKTGDIGYLGDDGKLYIIDRLKQIIKCNSILVSPSELESVIISHPKVKDVGVIGIPDDLYGEVPKAFIVPVDSELTAGDIIAHADGNHEQYKQLLGGVEFVDSIPKSITGKILRQELKKMAGL